MSLMPLTLLVSISGNGYQKQQIGLRGHSWHSAETSDAHLPVPYIVFIVHRSSPLFFLDLNNPDRPAKCPSKNLPFRLGYAQTLLSPLKVLSASYAKLLGPGPLFFRTRRSICPGRHGIREYQTFSGIRCARAEGRETKMRCLPPSFKP
jgi:hypothetical protein